MTEANSNPATKSPEISIPESERPPVFRFGWKPDSIDRRDCKLVMPGKLKYPKTCDLRSKFKQPDIYNQGDLGSCTANAIGFAYQFCTIAQNNTIKFQPSRLFIYYNERVIEDSVNEDAGAELRDGMKSINHTGVCCELNWPYDISQFKVKPPPLCYAEATTRKSIKYKRVVCNIDNIKYAISTGFPVVFGFYVYESFTKIGKDGIMQMPNFKTERFLGGHAVAAVGYDEKYLIVRNSWGAQWGDHGYFKMPLAYIHPSRTSDFWLLISITNPLKHARIESEFECSESQPPAKRAKINEEKTNKKH